VFEYGPEEGAVSVVTELCHVKYSMLAQIPADCTIEENDREIDVSLIFQMYNINN